jgi:meso-butanediol dehydrogenase / (S,S)-butanediol dehydrogenase / diacetyl reductase
MGRFTGKVVLVTGASSGLGAATALRLAAEDAQVFGIARNSDGLRAVQEQAQKNGGVMATASIDVGQPQQCAQAVLDCVAKYGRLDALINVAGRHDFRHTPSVTEQQWLQDLAVNLNGPFFLSQAAIPHLLENHGNIVNVASIAGLQGQPYSAAYCSAKHGLLGLTKALAMEYMKAPLRVNAIVPGGMDTPQVQNIQIPPDVDFDLVMRSAAPRGFMHVDDVAALIAFLASDEAKAVHGSIQVIDNGKTVG